MTQLTLIAVARYGLEKIVKNELINLGLDVTAVSPGRVDFAADSADIPTANLWLRSADRVRLKIGEFTTTTFDDLFEQTKALPWEQWITADGKFTVNGKSVKSTLFSIRSCQAIVNKAVAERLKDAHNTEMLPETGPSFTIEVSLLKDVALLTIDTSGSGLHRRGYRADAGEAPLKRIAGIIFGAIKLLVA